MTQINHPLFFSSRSSCFCMNLLGVPLTTFGCHALRRCNCFEYQKMYGRQTNQLHHTICITPGRGSLGLHHLRRPCPSGLHPLMLFCASPLSCFLCYPRSRCQHHHLWQPCFIIARGIVCKPSVRLTQRASPQVEVPSASTTSGGPVQAVSIRSCLALFLEFFAQGTSTHPGGVVPKVTEAALQVSLEKILLCALM